MPVEIRELLIRAVIDDPTSAKSELPADDSEGRAKRDDLLVEECVNQVLKILERGRER